MHNTFALVAIILFLIGTVVFAEDPAPPPETAAASATVSTSDRQEADFQSTYPLDYCLVDGTKLNANGDPIVYAHSGREVRFCSLDCLKTFKKAPEPFLNQFDQAIIERESKDYPLTTCVVTGEKLGSMGKPYNYIYNNHLVQFCCAHCVETFEKTPSVYLKMIETARSEAHRKSAVE